MSELAGEEWISSPANSHLLVFLLLGAGRYFFRTLAFTYLHRNCPASDLLGFQTHAYLNNSVGVRGGDVILVRTLRQCNAACEGAVAKFTSAFVDFLQCAG